MICPICTRLWSHDYTLLSLCLGCLRVQGHDSSCGLLSNLDQPAAEDSVVVKVLKRQGAIPYVKTNVPQGLLR